MIEAQLASNPTLSLQEYLNDDNLALEPKYDGSRIIVNVIGDSVSGFNRLGLLTWFFSSYTAFSDLRKVCKNDEEWMFDGEYIDGRIYIFDLLHVPSGYLLEKPFSYRSALLRKLFYDRPPMCTEIVPQAIGTEAKTKLFERCEGLGIEGVVFKKLDALYVPGSRTNSIKFKFWKEADFCIRELNKGGKKESVEIGLYTGTGWDYLTGARLISKYSHLKVDDVVTVRYLRVSEDKHLINPTIVRPRTDKYPTQCTVDQLHQEEYSRTYG